MSDDVIGDPILTLGGEAPPDAPLVVKLDPVVMKGMALTTLIEHGMRQGHVIQEMLNQATFALERARAASNDGPGSVLKMVIPIMIGRKQYFAREMQLWALVMEAAEAELEDIRPAIEAIDAANAAKEEANGGSGAEVGPDEGSAEAATGDRYGVRCGSGEAATGDGVGGQCEDVPMGSQLADSGEGDEEDYCNCGFKGTPDDCECDCDRFAPTQEPRPA